MMDEEIRQAISEVREMKRMCGNINMKLTNIVTQRGQDYKKKLEAEYQRGFEDGKAQSECRCEECEYKGKTGTNPMCSICSNNYKNYWTAKDDKIKVGDVVEHNVQCFVVTAINNEYVYGISKDGTCCFASIKNVRKTSRHFDIDKILEKIGEEEDFSDF